METNKLEISQGKTPSIHDCTQLTISYKPSNINTNDLLKLVLIVIDSAKMVIGSQYEIFPYGLSSSLRQLKDGCVYAGSQDSPENHINDIVLPEEEKGVGKKHFMVQYAKGKTY